LREKLCVVTGTSAGIGLAVAEALLSGGWAVAGVARRESPLRHPDYRHARLDLADTANLEARLEEYLGEELRRPGRSRLGLVNNAALLEPVGPLSRLAATELARAFAVNVVAPACLLGLCLRSGPGVRLRVVNVSSGAAAHPYAGWSAYCSTKAALRMVGLVAAAEADEFDRGSAAVADVSVVSYEPGVVDTSMQASVRSLGRDAFPKVQRFLDLHAGGALRPPSEPAEEIARLLERDDLPRFSETRLGA
jgi:NAD(P)-dependent dehydrogenase (short-subunit alcohol dehydrogenase family)